MANESTNNAKKEKFIGLLHQLFQLNQPELDFGLYRIMHAKSDQIKAFIKNDLAREIDDAFAGSGDDKIAELKTSYEQARAQAVDFGIADPDSNHKVKAAKEAYDAALENGDDPSDIYDHMYRFFSRYYDKGDFLSRRYHVGENESRAAPYAVPYDGREVYLHWANKDQYYIKSSEYLSNFSFDLSEAIEKERKRQGVAGQEGLDFGSPNTDTPIKVSLQLVDATEGAHNNVKETQTRFFIIHADKPVEVRPLVLAEGKSGVHELIINFEYRPDPEKSGQESGWQKKRLQEAESAILKALKSNENLKPFHDALTFLTPTEKQKDRTILAKYLTSYTARNTMDYFIHKDLGGFLRRELDFYIKNEIMRLDDLGCDDISGVTHSLKKITALRSIGRQIIDFLAQLESFQKKLWLKKKFVTETNYCLSLNYVPEELYEEVVENTAQWEEWVKLGFLEAKVARDSATTKANPFLILDTANFSTDFKNRLIAKIQDLDDTSQGLLIHSENFQALRLLGKNQQAKVKAIYLDPPYNSGGNDFLYKDAFRNSSWLSMLRDRLSVSDNLLSEDGVIFMHIDDKDEDNRVSHQLMNMVEAQYGKQNYLDNLIWVKNTTHNDAKTFSHNHEYILAFAKDRAKASATSEMFRQNKPGYAEVMEIIHARNPEYPAPDEVASEIKTLYREQMAAYKQQCIDEGLGWNDELKRNDPWKGIKQYKHVEYRLDSGEWIPFEEAKNKQAKLWVYRESDPSWPNANSLTEAHKTDGDSEYRFYKPIHPVTGKTCPAPARGWLWRQKLNPNKTTVLSFEELDKKHLIAYGEDENKVPQQKRFLHTVDTDVVKSAIVDFTDGEKELSGVFGERGTFPNPKPTSIGRKLIEITTSYGDVVMDYFSGSGTSIHAVLQQNLIDEKCRKYIGVEMGEHFGRTLLPRIKKASYAIHWKDGAYVQKNNKPTLFKYLRLESYEDTVNNLELSESVHSESFQNQDKNFRKDYLLKYFLDVETHGSASLLNIEHFNDPTSYSLMTKRPGSDHLLSTNVDLVETFNWLIGLEVALMDKPRTYDAEFEREHDPELPEDQHTRLKVKRFKEDEHGAHWFRVVEGYVRRTPGSDAGKEKVMVIWRKLTDKPEHDAAALEALLSKYRVNQSDTEFDKIYINGPHGLSLSGQAKAKILSIEETFMARMWEETDEAMH